MSEEQIEVYCPNCGAKVVCHYKSGNPGMNIYDFNGHCIGCDTPIFVEDRRSYEQEGDIEITLC